MYFDNLISKLSSAAQPSSKAFEFDGGVQSDAANTFGNALSKASQRADKSIERQSGQKAFDEETSAIKGRRSSDEWEAPDEQAAELAFVSALAMPAVQQSPKQSESATVETSKAVANDTSEVTADNEAPTQTAASATGDHSQSAEVATPAEVAPGDPEQTLQASKLTAAPALSQFPESAIAAPPPAATELVARSLMLETPANQPVPRSHRNVFNSVQQVLSDAAGLEASEAQSAKDALLDTQLENTIETSLSAVEIDTLPIVMTSGSALSVAMKSGSIDAPLDVAPRAVLPDVGSKEWAKALSLQLLQMGKVGQESAELQLNPPGLGPLKVILNMNEHQIQAAFVSTHASVRAAIEAALPQLRVSMAESGLTLGQTSVGADSHPPTDAGQNQERSAHRGYSTSDSRQTTTADSRTAVIHATPISGARLDIYA